MISRTCARQNVDNLWKFQNSNFFRGQRTLTHFSVRSSRTQSATLPLNKIYIAYFLSKKHIVQPKAYMLEFWNFGTSNTTPKYLYYYTIHILYILLLLVVLYLYSNPFFVIPTQFQNSNPTLHIIKKRPIFSRKNQKVIHTTTPIFLLSKSQIELYPTLGPYLKNLYKELYYRSISGIIQMSRKATLQNLWTAFQGGTKSY